MLLCSPKTQIKKAAVGILLFCSSAGFASPNLIFDLDNRLNHKQKENVQLWLEQGLSAVETSIADLPQRNIKFSVLKHNSSHPVPWGQIIRGNPDTVKLYVGHRASLNDMVNDWTLYHEISHLFLPYLDYSSFWLSEGFATYMQYLIMYQDKLLSKKKLIDKMQAGFERGRKNALSKPGKLKDVSSNMWQMRAYRRVYWSGAAFFLEAELALKAKGKSLSEVMTAYVDCCRRDNSSGMSLMRSLDRLSQTSIFVPLYKKYAERTDFPKVTKQQLESVAELYQPK